MWMIAWPILKANWKLVAIALAVLAGVLWHRGKVNDAYEAGRVSILNEQAVEARKRNTDANAADADARRCANDPACLMRDDPNRRPD